MALTVTVQNDAYPADTEFEVMGLGLFTNGESREVTEEQEKVFVSMNQAPVDEVIGENDNVSVEGTTAIENMDEVLGTDISTTVEVPPADASSGNLPQDATDAGNVLPPVDTSSGNTEIINPPEGGGN